MWVNFRVGTVENFAELERGSDRTIGVVASAVVESYLTGALKKEIHRDDTPYSNQVRSDTFNHDGPLGSFGAKIQLAYLMGYLTPEAHRDLTNLKNIRNQFAHYAEQHSFATDKIRDRCANFTLINERTRDIPGATIPSLNGMSVEDVKIYLDLACRDEILATPKGRFVNTAKLFCAAFEFYERAIGSEKPVI